MTLLCEDGSVSRAGQNPAPIKWGEKTFSWCHIFCISFVLVAKVTWMAMGTSERHFRILLPKARCLVPILEPTKEVGES